MQKIVVSILFFLIIATAGYAQEDSIPPTSTTDLKVKVNKKKERPKQKRYMTIIKTNTRKTLYGNKCFEDFTKELGFVYEIQVKDQSGSLSGFQRFWHNVGTKTALVFTAWPWWKLRVNKRYKECRKSSGDFVG
ncbi:MAG: hypothetical protein ABFS32_10320 [Bacteroidota bacterium]